MLFFSCGTKLARGLALGSTREVFMNKENLTGVGECSTGDCLTPYRKDMRAEALHHAIMSSHGQETGTSAIVERAEAFFTFLTAGEK